MLTTDQKAMILRQAGLVVPPFPGFAYSGQRPETTDSQAGSPDPAKGDHVEREVAAEAWAQTIEGLYIAYRNAHGDRAK
jgi:hypothetical protein